MATIERNTPPTNTDIESFLKDIDFRLPQGFIEFYKEANGANVSGDDVYVVLWPLTDLIRLNGLYNVHEYAPEFFIFGSNGADTAYAIERATGYIFEMPFIGMCREEAVFKNEKLDEFIEAI